MNSVFSLYRHLSIISPFEKDVSVSTLLSLAYESKTPNDCCKITRKISSGSAVLQVMLSLYISFLFLRKIMLTANYNATYCFFIGEYCSTFQLFRYLEFHYIFGNNIKVFQKGRRDEPVGMEGIKWNKACDLTRQGAFKLSDLFMYSYHLHWMNSLEENWTKNVRDEPGGRVWPPGCR